MKFFLLSLCALLAPLALALPEGALEARQNCKTDKCLRAVRNPFVNAAAKAFCSKYIATTVTVPVTVTKQTTVAGPTASTTLTITTSVTRTFTDQEPDVVSLTTTTTTAIVTEAAVIAKRDVQIRPPWLSDCLNPSAISSACICLITTRPTSTATTTVTVINTSTEPEVTQVFTTTLTAEALTTVTLAPTATIISTVTQTVTRTTCAADAPTQVVVNGGLETDGPGRVPPPWTATRTGGTVLLDLNFCGVAGPGRDCNNGVNCRCLFANADSPGGTGLFSQTLRGVCPGQAYNFEAYIGRSDNIIGGSEVRTTTSVKLDGVELVAPQIFCQLGQPCPIAGGSGPYLKVGPIRVVPQSVNPVLTFEFVTDIPAGQGIFSVDVFVDDITLTKV